VLDASFNVSFTPTEEGYYEFISTAEDVAGNAEPWPSDADARCLITGANIPPTVRILHPLNGTSVNGSVAVRGNASDPDGEVARVWLRIDGGNWTLCNGTTNWTWTWLTTAADNGWHLLEVRAWDGALYSEICTVEVRVENVSPDTDPPEILEVNVTFTSATGSVSVLCTVTDGSGISCVKASVRDGLGRELFSVNLSGHDSEYSAEFMLPGPGEYFIFITARDTADNLNTSEAYRVHFSPPGETGGQQPETPVFTHILISAAVVVTVLCVILILRRG
jgi:hypothetical protein